MQIERHSLEIYGKYFKLNLKVVSKADGYSLQDVVKERIIKPSISFALYDNLKHLSDNSIQIGAGAKKRNVKQVKKSSKRKGRKSYKSKENTSESSSINNSITNENNDIPPSSINTSDINMVTE